MNNQKIPMIILSECVVFPGSSVYLNLYDSRSENAVSQAIGPGGKLVESQGCRQKRQTMIIQNYIRWERYWKSNR